MTRPTIKRLMQIALLSSTILAAQGVAFAEESTVIDGNNGTLPLPSGQYVTPQVLTSVVQQPLNPGLSAYPNYVAGTAARSQLSPDGTTLAIICAGYNLLFNSAGVVDAPNSTQYVFLYNVAGSNKTQPVLSQVIKQPNAHVGLVWSPDGNTLYAAGGSDDAVYVYTKSSSGQFTSATPIALGHGAQNSSGGVGIGVQPNASGLAISSDGATLVVANNYNDSISVIDTASKTVRYEHDLRPYFVNNENTPGVAGGTFPFGVAIKGHGTAYISSDRDRQVVVVDISSPTAGKLITRIPLSGNGLGMTLNAAQTRLYVAQDNADQVAVIDTTANATLASIDARAPAGMIAGAQTGAATYGVTLSPDGNTLYAVNSGANSIAVIPLVGAGANTVVGLIPTAYEPHDVTFSADGSWMYIINGKSDTGPNPAHLNPTSANLQTTRLLTTVTYPGGNAAANTAAIAANQYQFQLERATLVSARVPTETDLPALTNQVAQNNFYSAPANVADNKTMVFMRSKIQHVIYVVKENRTFDQILGDLDNGANGDPTLTVFGKRITPNFHRLSHRFVTLDNFMDPADGSMDGWSWSTAGRVTNTEALTQQINYASRGLSYESEGSNRGVPVGLATQSARDAATSGNYSKLSATQPGGTANLLVGRDNHAATDAPYGVQKGYIFDAVLHAGLTVRNYGFLTNNIGSIGTDQNPVTDPYRAGVVQVAATNPSLRDKTDVYFRGFDQSYPDLWRFNEWNREFQHYVTTGKLPSLSLVRLSHDHMGNFPVALAGVNTPETQQADDDLAVGRLVETVAHSPFASNTVIFITEDDSQDAPDHFDSHRATAYVVGPYVRQGALVSTRYNSVSMLRTIEDLLGTQHINLNTAYQRPMADVFDVRSTGRWTYTSSVSRILGTTTLQLAENGAGIHYADNEPLAPKHDAAYWAKATSGFDFSDADAVPTDLFNEVLWEGLKDGQPYPTHRSGLKLGGGATN